MGRWAATAFFDSPAHLWAFYLTPLLFFAVQLGFVAVALKQTHKRGMRPVVQFLLGLLVFAVAAIPAALLALVPSAILALLRSDTLVSTAAVTILPGENTGSGAAR